MSKNKNDLLLLNNVLINLIEFISQSSNMLSVIWTKYYAVLLI